MNLDLSRLLEKPECAVRASTREQAEIIVEELKLRFPKRTEAWRGNDTHFSEYGGNGTYYSFFWDIGLESNNLVYSSPDYFEHRGYEIIQFEDLQISDMEESDQSLDFIM